MESRSKFEKTIVVLGLTASILGAPSGVLYGAETSAPGTASSTLNTASSTPVKPGPTRQELEKLIEQRAQVLEKINQDLAATQENLQNTKDQRVTLQRQLRTLDYSINQLQLNIQADEVTGQKLGLEIDSLNYDIRDIEISIDDKRVTIVHLLQELQKKDKTNLFVVFLKNENLADGVLETQSLSNLRAQLAADINNLTSLHEQLNGKVQSVGVKKASIELHRKNLVARKSIVEDQKQERKGILTQTQSKESEYEKQVDDLKKQQDTLADEISKVEDQLRQNFDVSVVPVKRRGVFAWPVEMKQDGGIGVVTQHFGERSRLYRGKPHNGLDIGVPLGTPVFAAADGVVTAVDNNDRGRWNKYQYGKYILIKHPNNLETLYAHLSRQVVERGMTVKRGDLIGYAGKTGYATGPHIHFGAYWAPSLIMKSIPPAAGLVPVGVLVNPEDYL